MTGRGGTRMGPGRSPGRDGNRATRSHGSGEPAVVALRMEELTLWVMQRVAKMARAHKFTVGDRLVETCLDVSAGLMDAE